MQELRINLSHTGRIDSWRAIAAFLGRDERTVQRWEKERLLPVHRALGDRGPVFAYKRELLRWLHTEPASPLLKGLATGEGILRTHTSSNNAAAEMAARMSVRAEQESATLTLAGKGVHWMYWVAAGAFTILLFLADSYHARVQAAPALERNTVVSAALGSPNGREPAAPADTTSDRQLAYESYLKGRYDWNRRTGDSLERARDEFMQAILHDANDAEAYAGLAATYELMPQYSAVPVAEAFPRGLIAARKAVALGPDLAEAHRVLGFALFYWEWNVPGAFAEFHRAMELDPTDAEAHHWCATALLTLRRSSEARAEIQRARELNPGSRAILADQILINATGQPDVNSSLAQLKDMAHREPDFLSPPRYMNQLLLARGDFAGWVAQLQKTAQRSQTSSDRALARAAEQGWQKGGERGLFTALRKTQLKLFNDGDATGYDLALTCLHLGDKEAAVRYLQAAYDAHDFRLLSIVHDPADAALRGIGPYEALRHTVAIRVGDPA